MQERKDIMELIEAIRRRRSIRAYQKKEIEPALRKELSRWVEEENKKSGLSMRLLFNEPKAFQGWLAHYGSFRNTANYLVLAGKKDASFYERCGYYGERFVLHAVSHQIDTCWTALSFSKRAVRPLLAEKETLCCVIAFGYGAEQGKARRRKEIEKLCHVEKEMPAWFHQAMQCVQLAPSAMNQQNYLFTLEENRVQAKALRGFYSAVDLGIAKYHFEIGAQNASWSWKQEDSKRSAIF